MAGWHKSSRHERGYGAEWVKTRGRKVMHDVYWCPVRYTPTQQQVDSARRAYREWYRALLFLAVQLRRLGILSRIEITQTLPPRRPWALRLLTESQRIDRLPLARGATRGIDLSAADTPDHRGAT